MTDSDAQNASFTPAPIPTRLIAGAIDAAAVGFIVVALVSMHVLFAGAALPLWTIGAVALAWNVVPAWLWNATPGMRIVGLEFRGTDGEPPDLLELGFRELVGRGVLALAYLGTFMIAVVSAIVGVGALNLPIGWALLLFLGALGMLAGAGVGQFVMLLRPDHRSVADLISKVQVIVRPADLQALATPKRVIAEGTEEPDDVWEGVQRRTRLRNFAIVEVILIVFAAGVPLVNRLDLGGSIDPVAASRQAEADQYLYDVRKSWRSNRAGREETNELVRLLRRRGEHEEAEAILTEHREARKLSDDKREKRLLAALEKNDDWDAFTRLLELYAEQERFEDSRRAWERYLEMDDSVETVATYGIWLYRNDYNDEAAVVLKQAIDDGHDGGDMWAYYGYALDYAGKKSEARDAYVEAVDRDGELADDLDFRISELDHELGARPKKKKRKKRRR